MGARRVLLIAYYFPPSGGPGVQRVLKFAKYLPQHGWHPVVLTVRAGAYPEYDPSLLQDVPPALDVHRTASVDPYQWYARFTSRSKEEAVVVGSFRDRQASWKEQLALWIRANVFVPDARVGWVPFALARGYRLLRGSAFDAMVTSGPPHSVHLTGWGLHRLTRTLWLADFRDPWTDITYYDELPHTAWARRLDAALERAVLREATTVTTVSPAWKRLLAAKVPAANTAFAVVHNGYDEEDFASGMDAYSDSPKADPFVLAHVGSLYGSRNPTALWEALRRLRAQGEVEALRLRLVGPVDPSVWQALGQHGLAEIAEQIPYAPHEEAVLYMRRSTLLLLVIEPFAQAAGMITGKLYEYLAAGRPVLGIGPPNGDAAALLQETGAGRMYGHDDVEGIAVHLRQQYEVWVAGQPLPGVSGSAVRPYSRQAQTNVLADLLDELRQGG